MPRGAAGGDSAVGKALTSATVAGSKLNNERYMMMLMSDFQSYAMGPMVVVYSPAKVHNKQRRPPEEGFVETAGKNVAIVDGQTRDGLSTLCSTFSLVFCCRVPMRPNANPTGPDVGSQGPGVSWHARRGAVCGEE